MIKHGKPWEPATRGCWRELLAKDKLVLDVGAYTGIYAIASALMGAKVIALEPHPPNYQRVTDNAALNHVSIILHQAAASSERGVLPLRMRKPVYAINDMASVEGNDSTTVLVPAIPIDGLGIVSAVGLIKIDVEGHELNVLQGARETIALHRPYILVELLTEQARRNVDALLKTHGYRHQAVFDNRNHLYT
jgi:FkbM family methyltransferase